MPTVFLSYRRADSQDVAARLRQAFQAKVGARWSFQDVADIPPGTDWDETIQENLRTARVVLVLIGPSWLKELTSRLSQPADDVLRREIVTALSKKSRRVVPVLLHGATLPPASSLPDDLRPLGKRQWFMLSDETWDRDVDRLIASIGRPYRWSHLVMRSVAAFFVIAALVWKGLAAIVPSRASDYVFVRVVLFGLVAAYVLFELTLAALYLARQRR